MLGWTGHHINTFKTNVLQKALYYGDKETAQFYANINGKDKGAVALIAARDQPAHGAQRFEGLFAPLDPDSMREKGTVLLHIEMVTSATDAQFPACLKRGVDDVNTVVKDLFSHFMK